MSVDSNQKTRDNTTPPEENSSSKRKLWLGLLAVVGIAVVFGALRISGIAGRATGEDGPPVGCGGPMPTNTTSSLDAPSGDSTNQATKEPSGLLATKAGGTFRLLTPKQQEQAERKRLRLWKAKQKQMALDGASQTNPTLVSPGGMKITLLTPKQQEEAERKRLQTLKQRLAQAQDIQPDQPNIGAQALKFKLLTPKQQEKAEQKRLRAWKTRNQSKP